MYPKKIGLFRPGTNKDLVSVKNYRLNEKFCEILAEGFKIDKNIKRCVLSGNKMNQICA
jgi:hypothetical protein